MLTVTVAWSYSDDIGI